MEREPRLRRATAGDAKAIAAIQVETWRVAYAHAFPSEYLEGLSVDERRDLWTRTLSGGMFDVFVAELGGRVVGFVSSGPAEDESAPGELFALYVEPADWGKGAGRALLERAERAFATPVSTPPSCGCWRTTRGHGACTRPPVGARTAAESVSRTGAWTRSPFAIASVWGPSGRRAAVRRTTGGPAGRA